MSPPASAPNMSFDETPSSNARTGTPQGAKRDSTFAFEHQLPDPAAKRQERHPDPAKSARTSIKLTQTTLAEHNEQYDDLAASFDAEMNSRVVQNAGKGMGFDMKLDCYDQAAVGLMDWLDSRNTELRAHLLFKNPGDIAAMIQAASSFETALADATTVG
ncbi:hypothetical protein EK21DRAFT_114333 [Setomelanomma holmii]|uniref:Uncharacterized protein n=1 Tax=Setomelanomma holmii TaxID=210430 RepID=A0A9P4H5E7_9PLEO|nr:hypothetical protein EK21DRAFT_114333 [Setomelanomma holmii]